MGAAFGYEVIRFANPSLRPSIVFCEIMTESQLSLTNQHANCSLSHERGLARPAHTSLLNIDKLYTTKRTAPFTRVFSAKTKKLWERHTMWGRVALAATNHLQWPDLLTWLSLQPKEIRQ